MTYPQILNKRIAELISESYIEVPHERDWDAMSTVFDKQKFAELIIKECVMIVEGCERTDEVSDGEYQDYDAAVMIKDHFGIK